MSKIYSLALRMFPALKRLNEHGLAIHSLESEINNLKWNRAYGYASSFNPFARHLSRKELEAIADKWLPKFGYDTDENGFKMLGYIAHRICCVEYICTGRIHGAITTHMVRSLTARSVKAQNLNVLEIGTAFGIGAIEIYDICLGSFDNIHMTLIDPLAGHYGETLDNHARIPITRQIVESNMQRCAIPESNYTIIQRLSQDKSAMSEAASQRYDVLVIDADHSYEGVKSDYINYRPLVKEGGYIVFDDYWTNYPGIIKFVDEEVKGTPDVSLVGADADDRIAVFKALK